MAMAKFRYFLNYRLLEQIDTGLNRKIEQFSVAWWRADSFDLGVASLASGVLAGMGIHEFRNGYS